MRSRPPAQGKAQAPPADCRKLVFGLVVDLGFLLSLGQYNTLLQTNLNHHNGGWSCFRPKAACLHVHLIDMERTQVGLLWQGHTGTMLQKIFIHGFNLDDLSERNICCDPTIASLCLCRVCVAGHTGRQAGLYCMSVARQTGL